MIKGTARLIRAWGSGQLEADIVAPGEGRSWEGTLAVVLSSQEQLEPAIGSGVVAADSRVFSPGAADDDSGPIVMGYDGSLTDPGGDVQIGPQFFLQTQDYGTSEYLSLIGATLIRVVDEQDFAAYLSDADNAYTEGVFVDFVSHPMVRLCDVGALGATTPADGPRLRLWVDEGDVVHTSVAGAPLGSLTDGLPALEQQWKEFNAASAGPCAVSLATAVPEATRVEALARRPWLGHYLDAVAAIRSLRIRQNGDLGRLKVSGFGHRVDPDLQGVTGADVAAGAPVLLWEGEVGYLYAPDTERLFQLSIPVARHVERLLVHGNLADAAAGGDLSDLTAVQEHFSRAGVDLSPRG